jgi:hypothetical protein
MKKLISGVAIVALAFGGVIIGAGAASATPPDTICSEAGYEPKVDTVGDPATVPYTAPDGFLVDSYCVKAGTTKHIIAVDPPSETVTIDHPEKDSVSHYQVRLIPEPVIEQPDPDPVAVPVQPTAAAGIETCVEGASVDANGTITLPAFEGGHWAEGSGTLTNVPPGEYGFTPVIDEGYDYDGPAMWFVTVPASVDVECEVPPTTYLPSCTTVLDYHTIASSGVISVSGDWDSESIAVPLNGVGTLADIGTVLNIEADPLQYVGLHIDTAEGTIVFEEEPSYGGNLWSNDSWDGVAPGMGYAAFGSITEYIHLNGDVAVTGIRLLYTSPVASSTTVESFIIGCTEYTFAVIPEKPADVVVTSDWSAPVITCDNEPLDVVQQTRTITTTTYSWDAEAWQWVPGEPVVVTEEQGYVVTSADLEALDCPVVTPEPTETPVPVAKPAAKPAALAATGGPDMTPVLWIGGALVALGSAFAVLVGMGGRRRHQHED